MAYGSKRFDNFRSDVYLADPTLSELRQDDTRSLSLALVYAFLSYETELTYTNTRNTSNLKGIEADLEQDLVAFEDESVDLKMSVSF